VDEQDSEILRELFDQPIHENRIPVVDKNELVQAGGFGELLELLLGHVGVGFQAGSVGNIEQVRADGIASFGLVVVPVHAMLGGADAAQHGGVAYQGNAWIDGLRAERIGALLHQGEQVRHGRQRNGIRAETVNGQDHDAACPRRRR
jgi:hypothetical protein